MSKKAINIIIETDLEGKYCSCIPVNDKAIAEKITSMYKSGKQGFLHNYKIEEHYL